MVTPSDQTMRASLQVAPLNLFKPRSDSLLDTTTASQTDTTAGGCPYATNADMTPPTTPSDAHQNDFIEEQLPPPVFHNFLRAFYPFDPNYSLNDSSVTVPLAEGDVILVHSIHTNGWADGTLLLSGNRGWLPTNYCEAYDPEEMRNLLKALLNFWDLLRSTAVNDSEIFGNQEFMKGIIAGVRYLLERTHCLTRESPIIQRNDGLRRARKSLLSELSALVTTAKRLQEGQRAGHASNEIINNIIDEMILKAFKIVTKAVRFLDILEEDRRMRAPAVTHMATVMEESYIPPTPPADSTRFDERFNASDASSRSGAYLALTAETSTTTTPPQAADAAGAPPTNKRLSAVMSSPGGVSHRLSQNLNRISSSISHRVSLAGHSPLSRPQHLVSERLNKSHDAFLSHLGSFIGRLHLQSQSRPELAFAVKLSATSGGHLLMVVDVICGHNNMGSDVLPRLRDLLFQRIQELVSTAGQIIHHAASQEEDVIMPQDNGVLLMAATGCVKAAGECVAKTRGVIERVGDFEYEAELGELPLDLSTLDVVPFARRPSAAPSVAETTTSQATSVADSNATDSQRKRFGADKPLPSLPSAASELNDPLPSPRPASYDDNASSIASSVSSIRPSLPPLPRLSTSVPPSEDYSPIDHSSRDGDAHSSFRSDIMTTSSAGSSATYISRDSESSIVSQTSTRATTPDHTMVATSAPSISDVSTTGSLTLAEEADDVEEKLLEKTYAHELMFNKEGQVTGGSLPALVERLTTHESTPDATFVSTFYLTFRLFCTPARLTEVLIHRFDYVAEAPHMAGPVRLRVYNAFKNWLESHWRDETDRDALDLIVPFAQDKLSAVIPSAGRRLLELARRVSNEGSLVPRNVSSIGKTNTAIAQYIPADTPHPAVIFSKSQQHAMNNWKNGGSSPSITDFDPVEIARQLTIRQMNTFCGILPAELLGSEWTKRGGKNAPNVKAMTAFSTDLSNLVAETILQCGEIKKRAAVIKHWIKIAHQCFELHNYDSLMAIVCTLNSSTIERLRKTWDLISTKRRDMFRQLQSMVDTSQNHKALRSRLNDHVPPCLPFLGMYLTDLTFVDVGNPATKQLPTLGHEGDGNDEGLVVVNFDKHTRTAKIIGELQRFQIPYRLTEVPEMQDWMAAQIGRVREDDKGNIPQTNYRKSLLLEPREPVQRPQIDTSVANQRDIFSWMTRDRGATTPAPA